IGTGESHSVREFIESAFSYAGLNFDDYVSFDKKFFRPAEVDDLIADTTKSTIQLNWKPKLTFTDLMKVMVDSDMRALGLEPMGEGDEILRKLYPDRWWAKD
ncbi:MAG TPA: GDP-mannose 4,6-dehydratase, partial [Methanocorpusculum sp.]|nr:GDP-mannose 4,6-dehydratase [Methanocorpusculum sp.]